MAIRIFKKLPPREHSAGRRGQTRYTRYFAAAHRNRGKFIEVPGASLLSLFGTARNHGLRAVQRQGRVFVFAAAARKRRSK
jgi:hypothetical protein